MIPGRYILQPEIMAILGRQTAGAGGEIQLTDAIARLIGRQPVHGVTFAGQRYDCGDKAQFIEANVALALARHDIGDAVRDRIARALDATPRPDAPLAQAHHRAGRNGNAVPPNAGLCQAQPAV